MLLLAMDTTTRVCSVALGEKGNILADYLLNIEKTHSQRLMPLIISLLDDSGVKREQLEGLAVAVGPGSFTGIRIGVATARGLAQGLGIPLIGVNTLEALAGGAASYPGLICPLLDARREQVYTAVYRGGSSGLETVEQPQALSLRELARVLKARGEEVLFLGDNMSHFRQVLEPLLPELYREMPYAMTLNRASAVLEQAFVNWQKEGPTPLYALNPFYIRLPEAQRRLLEKEKGVEV